MKVFWRRLRLVIVTLLCLVAGAVAGVWVYERMSLQRSLARQAAEIAAHRAAQRAAAAAPAAVPLPAPAATTTATARSAPAPPSPPYWTGFRGPERDGHYRQRPILTKWPSSGLRPMWKQPVGIGYASFVAANGRAFTIEQRGNQEVVSAYDVLTGRELWTHTSNRSFGGNQGGPRATPTWHDGVVYALGATGELRALTEADGRQIWRTDILEDAGAGNLDFGMAASPLVVDDTVVVLPGGGNGKSVVAYDRRTGKPAWSALDDAASYSSPMLATIEGVRQIVVLTASRVVGLTPDRGGLLWEFSWPYEQNPPQPVILGDRVLISTSSGGGAVMIELTRSGDRFAARELWRTNRMKNNFSSSVHHDGFIYGLDEFILACIDASTGELKWKGGRYGYGQVMLASGHLIVTTEQGEIALVRAAPESHQEVVRFAAIEGQTYNHPAIADGILLIRNAKEMAAFDLRSK
jgi:outer membrane protein assembly factor BamB